MITRVLCWRHGCAVSLLIINHSVTMTVHSDAEARTMPYRLWDFKAERVIFFV